MIKGNFHVGDLLYVKNMCSVILWSSALSSVAIIKKNDTLIVLDMKPNFWRASFIEGEDPSLRKESKMIEVFSRYGVWLVHCEALNAAVA